MKENKVQQISHKLINIVVGDLGEELSSIKPSTMPDTYWITLQARLTRERAAVTG